MSRGIQNNNPGNVRKSGLIWLGQVDGQDPDFVTFDTMTNGIRCLCRILLTYYRIYHLNTITQIISRWAPSTENDTQAYITEVCNYTGDTPDQALDITQPMTLSMLAQAIMIQENGQAGFNQISSNDVNSGVSLALQTSDA